MNNFRILRVKNVWGEIFESSPAINQGISDTIAAMNKKNEIKDTYNPATALSLGRPHEELDCKWIPEKVATVFDDGTDLLSQVKPLFPSGFNL